MVAQLTLNLHKKFRFTQFRVTQLDLVITNRNKKEICFIYSALFNCPLYSSTFMYYLVSSLSSFIVSFTIFSLLFRSIYSPLSLFPLSPFFHSHLFSVSSFTSFSFLSSLLHFSFPSLTLSSLFFNNFHLNSFLSPLSRFSLSLLSLFSPPQLVSLYSFTFSLSSLSLFSISSFLGRYLFSVVGKDMFVQMLNLLSAQVTVLKFLSLKEHAAGVYTMQNRYQGCGSGFDQKTGSRALYLKNVIRCIF